MRVYLVALALFLAPPVQARDLGVPPDKGWQHALTGLILMPGVAGLQRAGLSDLTESEHDIVAQYGAADGSLAATVYVFHAAIPDPALWFDRSIFALREREEYRDARPATADPVAFAAAGSTAATALRQSFDLAQGPARSTSVALIPLGDWIVKIRMSATRLPAAELDQKLLMFASALRWPTPAIRPALPVQPIQACAAPLAFAKARPVRMSGGDMLISLLGGVSAANTADKAKPAPPPPVWCREGEARSEYGVYRANAERDAYVLALYDSGRVVNVSPALVASAGSSKTYAVTRSDVDGSVSTYGSFTALPRPEQVWSMVQGGRPTGRSQGGKITMEPPN